MYIETLRVPGVSILRHKTPKKVSLHLTRTKWSNWRKATLEEAFSFVARVYVEALERLTKPLLLLIDLNSEAAFA